VTLKEKSGNIDWNIDIKTLKSRAKKSEGKTEKRYEKILGRKPAPDTHATATGCGKNQLTAAK
jgi:hypothetical protein